MKFSRSERPSGMMFGLKGAAIALLTAVSLSACGTPPIQHGYVLSEEALAQVPVGSSREQVLLVLGSPSTTSTLSGDTFYYISQTIDENPLMGRTVTDQRVLAIYFDEQGLVKQIANYGLKDGKVFDFIERKTRTGGADLNLLAQIFNGVGRVNPLGNMN
ncbi:outer membrane protein assembly factor BamE [Pleomorphomonas sp. JP5]|uniref:outer membrane protein assembly factor BamE n=1 Tax=Pleomorphomonas sp. JP5 TaxID=2942998 RepID=UPI00204329B1|nr:outer membrane protein assembly factor BamE [Pleomorphomonas sp. JP5]MCM5559941.1 outer membrane protein assembly factor BamE [Pleomorphomonas sp. JP5]